MAAYPYLVSNTASEAPRASIKSFTFTSSLSKDMATDICRSIAVPTPGHQELTVKESGTLFNAPIVYKRLALPSFQRLRATVSIQPSTSNDRDQVGVLFVLPSAPAPEDGGKGGSREEVGRKGQWIKVGLVFEGGETCIKTVVCDHWEDTSIVQTGIKVLADGTHEASIELRRDDDDGSLWIYVVDDGKKIVIRQVSWILHLGSNVEGTSVKQPMREAWAGCYCARPALNAEKEKLVARVSDFELVVRSPEQMGVLK